jgi:hypothetical protein
VLVVRLPTGKAIRQFFTLVGRQTIPKLTTHPACQLTTHPALLVLLVRMVGLRAGSLLP